MDVRLYYVQPVFLHELITGLFIRSVNTTASLSLKCTRLYHHNSAISLFVSHSPFPLKVSEKGIVK